MLVLNQEEREVIKKVVNDLMSKSGLLRGQYDARNGSAEFMYGVVTAMANFAYLVGDGQGEVFEDTFFRNMTECEEKELTNES